MPIMLNTLLREAGLPPEGVRLIRHKDARATRGRGPYDLWRDARPQFDLYQSRQSPSHRKKLAALYWAVFVVNSQNDTMFAGIYQVGLRTILDRDEPKPHIAGEIEWVTRELEDGVVRVTRRLLADVSEDKGAIRRFGDRRGGILGPVAE